MAILLVEIQLHRLGCDVGHGEMVELERQTLTCKIQTDGVRRILRSHQARDIYRRGTIGQPIRDTNRKSTAFESNHNTDACGGTSRRGHVRVRHARGRDCGLIALLATSFSPLVH